MFDLSGRVAIVSGCNTGLGQGMALALAQAGCDIVGLNIVPANETAAAVERMERRFKDIPTDLSSAKAEDLVARATAAFGRIDILVNNAGIIRRADALEFSERDWDDVIAVNLKAVFFLAQAAARQFIRQQATGLSKGGRIINTASLLSFQGGIRVPSYTAAKSGVLGLTRLLANEWAKYGITVNAIAPGYMDTDNTAALRADADRSKEILARIPMGRWGLPSDLAGPVVFLASDAAAYVTGHALAVDGGWLAR
jgi:2-deoxy-D-gluconate 3-dehydrogenase